MALLAAVAPRYGWHRDELYFLEAGRHLAWGYVDQPPFTPFVARAVDALAPGNLVVLRLLPALGTAATVVLAALIVRELGGGRPAQVTGAAAMAAGGFVLGVGHLLSTAAFDLTAWMALLWVVTRMLRTGEPRWWLAFGAVAGVSMLNKNLLLLLVAAVGAGVVAERRWDLLWSRWVPAGAAVAAVIAAPNLVWQAQHGWPQIEMGRVLARRLGAENRATLVPLQLLFVGPPLAWLLWFGARWLARGPGASRFRPLLWAWAAGLVLAFLTGGRPYYVLPLTALVMLAGIVAWTERRSPRLLAWLIATNALVSLPLALPLLPPSMVEVSASVNEAAAETIGWPQLVDQVAAVVRSLPPAEASRVVVLTATYGEAGAVDRFGPGRGLPHAFSPHNAYADFRHPTDPRATVVAVRFRIDRLSPYFDRCEQVASVDNGLGVDNEVQGTPILVCRGLRESWARTWERLRFLS